MSEEKFEITRDDIVQGRRIDVGTKGKYYIILGWGFRDRVLMQGTYPSGTKFSVTQDFEVIKEHFEDSISKARWSNV